MSQRAGLPPLLAIDWRGASLAEGVRAGLAVAAVVALDQWVRWPGLMEAALGALLTCLCDAGGPVRRRLPALLTFGAVGAAMVALSGLLGPMTPWLVVIGAALCVFLTSFARIFGPSAMQVGNLLTVVLVLALRLPVPDPRRAAALAGMFLAGSLWALLLTMGIWRLYPYQPARRAVAEIYRQLALLADDLRRLLADPGADEAAWDRHARQHRRRVRDAIERAREVVLQTVRVRGPVTGRAAQSWIRLEAADQMFSGLIALSDLLAERRADATLVVRAARMLRLLRPLLLLLQGAIAADTQATRPGLERAAAALRGVAGGDGAGPADALSGIAAALAERLRIAVTLSGAEAYLPRPAAAPGRWWATLRANLDWQSDALRHALRAALLAGAGFAVTRIWPGPYVHWFTITLVLTVQPYFALTFMRALERIGGTVLGGIAAAGLSTVATTPLAIATALFPLTMLALAVRQVSFGLYIACLTPLVVLLSELGRPGSSEVAIALYRAGFTVAGGALALAGAWLLWPRWEPARVRGQVTTALAAHARYAATQIEWLLGAAPAAAVERARAAAGVASNALEASLQRALLEPRRRTAAQLEAALTIDAALRRIAGRLSSVHLSARPAAPHDAARWRAWAGFLSALADRATSGGTLPPRPALPEGEPEADALARVVAQFDLAAGAAARLTPPAGG